MKSRLLLFARPCNAGFSRVRSRVSPPRKENYLRDGDSSRPIRSQRHDYRRLRSNGNDPHSSPRSSAPSAPPPAFPLFFSLPPKTNFFFRGNVRARARAREHEGARARYDRARRTECARDTTFPPLKGTTSAARFWISYPIGTLATARLRPREARKLLREATRCLGHDYTREHLRCRGADHAPRRSSPFSSRPELVRQIALYVTLYCCPVLRYDVISLSPRVDISYASHVLICRSCTRARARALL